MESKLPELSTLLIFVAACFAIAVTPGPDMLLVISRSLSQGRSAGFSIYAGTATGIFVHALAAAFGLSQLFLTLPFAYDAVRYLGAAYLLYLAYKTLTSKQGVAPSSTPNSHFSNWNMFRQGLLTNILNPKIILFILALFPQFVDPAIGSVAVQIIILACVFNLIGLIVLGTIIITASKVKQKFANNGRFKRAPQYLMATVFAGLAARLIFDQRS